MIPRLARFCSWDNITSEVSHWKAKRLTAKLGGVDLYLAVYPASVLYRFRIKAKRKIALSLPLGLGSMCVSSSTIIAQLRLIGSMLRYNCV